jgi:hypothetical protein
MKGLLLFIGGVVCGGALVAIPRIAGHLRAAVHGMRESSTAPEQARVHSEARFAFTARAPMALVTPLFGANKERLWSPGWNPSFLHPLPAGDEQGMVFTVAHDHLKSVWVNTEFDAKNGRVQYVYVIPDALVTVITLQMKPDGDHTQVEVEYDRTALSAEADGHARHLAEGDRTSGPEWERQVNEYLGKVARR